MAKTLEQLYAELDGDATKAFDDAREAKVAEIAAAIADYLKDDLDADSVAEDMMASAEEMGRIHDNTVSFELPARYTKNGHANPMMV